jgi:hypothetical protein
VGVRDRASVNDLPNRGWADLCIGTTYRRLRVACGESNDSVRYVDVARNIFVEPLRERPESGLIVGSNFGFDGDNRIWANEMNPNLGESWWFNGVGCRNGESTMGLNINGTLCTWEVALCFGQGILGDRSFFVYVAE